jgi:putative peptide zinc metalloprotease protein
MSSSLFSSRWHRIASSKPCLVSPLRVQRIVQRGTPWWVLGNPAGGRQVRLDPAAYALVARMDGHHTVGDLWTWHLAQPVSETSSQDDLIDMLAQLREAGLVHADGGADFDTLLPHLERVQSGRARASLLAWRLPMGDPSRLLHRLAPVAPWLFNQATAIAWCLALVWLLIGVVLHAPTLWAHGEQWLATPRYVLLAVALYVPLKVIHEAAHALAVIRHGGAVREWGVTLMLGLPVPYVDASAAAGFVRRRDRVLVGAAGVMAELAIAAVSLALWLTLDDGLMRDVCFVMMVVAGVSSLVFNANPLQRLDGYFVATDLLDLPNLAARSRQWWQLALQRRALRLSHIEPMPMARGEGPWLAAYAPASFLYGVLIAALAVSWLGRMSFWLGLVAGVVLAWQLLLRPAYTLASQLRRSALGGQASTDRWQRLSWAAALAMAVVAGAPLPQRHVIEGVVWPADEALLRAAEDGFVDELLVRDAQLVDAGTPVMRLSNPALQTRLDRQRARAAMLEASLIDALEGRDAITSGDARAANLRAELHTTQAEVEHLQQRVEALEVRTSVAGRVSLPLEGDLPGRWLPRGELIGHVLDGQAPRVRVPWPAARTTESLADAPRIDVRLASQPHIVHTAAVERDAVAAVSRLPSPALSTRHGGQVVTDPSDQHDTKPLQPVVMMDVRVNQKTPPAPSSDPALATGDAPSFSRIGERALVRFDAGWSPLAWQAAQWARRHALHTFNPQI